MVEVTLYKMHDRVLEGDAILEGTTTLRNDFFNSLPNEALSINLSPAWIKNIENINNSITIKLDGRTPLLEYNYMKITIDSFDHLFFITGYEETGANQVRYILRKDTLNTYAAWRALGVDWGSSLGLVLREHKDRFSSVYNNRLTPKFDRTIEDFSYDNKEYNLLHTIPPNRTRLALKQYGGGVKNEEVLSNPMFLWEIFNDNIIDVSEWGYYKFPLEFGWGFKVPTRGFDIKFAPNNLLRFEELDNPFKNNVGSLIVIRKELNSQNEITGYLIELIYPDGTVKDLTGGTSYGTFEKVGLRWRVDYDVGDRLFVKVLNDFVGDLKIYYDLGFEIGSSFRLKQLTSDKLNSIVRTSDLNKINLRDERITKIIELPYFAKAEGFPKFFEALSPVNFNLDLRVPSQYREYDFDPSLKVNRIEGLDPKLYTSQFNPVFITFMNEAIALKKELLNGLQDHTDYNHVLNVGDYSKIALSLIDKGYKFEEPYQFDKVIDMNNEVTTIGSDLKSYLDNLYSNDLKLIQMQDIQANRNLQKQAVSIGVNTALGFGAGAMTGNPVGAGVGAVIGLAKGAMDYSYSVKQAKHDRQVRQIEYENKLINLQSSLINVTGGTPEMKHINNADAFKAYEIKPIELERKFIEDQFYYYGYSTLEIRRKHNDFNRLLFEYKQIVFKELKTTRNLTIEVKSDIINKFSNGITFFRYLKHWGMFTEYYDFEQQYENWEMEAIYG